jgi:hypothetical protein
VTAAQWQCWTLKDEGGGSISFKRNPKGAACYQDSVSSTHLGGTVTGAISSFDKTALPIHLGASCNNTDFEDAAVITRDLTGYSVSASSTE